MQSSSALRLLSPVSSVLGPADPDSLQNIVTDELPDGSLCVVTGVGLYLLDKQSQETPIGTAVVQPVSGPGLWIFVLASDPIITVQSAHSQLSAGSSGSAVVTSGGQGVWTVFPTTNYDGDFDATKWSFDFTTGVLTYLGPNAQFEITAYLSAAPSSANVAQIGLDIAVNEDLVGGNTRTAHTMEVLTGAATTDVVSLSTSRVANVFTNQTVRAVAWNAAAARDITALSLQLVVRPF